MNREINEISEKYFSLISLISLLVFFRSLMARQQALEVHAVEARGAGRAGEVTVVPR